MLDKAHTEETARTGGEKAYLRLREDIVSGALAPGQKLKIEMLKDRYAMSVGPLREAMSRLTSEYLIEQSGQRGFFVAPLTARDAREIGELRLLVEIEALQRSIPNGDTAWEEKVITTFFRLGQVETSNDTGPDALARWEQLNEAFHNALVSACDSGWVVRIRQGMFQHHERYRRLSRIKTRFDRDIHAEHKALMSAALDRDVEEAERVIRIHIERTTEAVTNAIARRQEEEVAAEG